MSVELSNPLSSLLMEALQVHILRPPLTLYSIHLCHLCYVTWSDSAFVLLLLVCVVMVNAPLGFSRLEFSVLFLPYAFLLCDGSRYSGGFPLVIYAGATHLHGKLRYSHHCLWWVRKVERDFGHSSICYFLRILCKQCLSFKDLALWKVSFSHGEICNFSILDYSLCFGFFKRVVMRERGLLLLFGVWTSPQNFLC